MRPLAAAAFRLAVFGLLLPRAWPAYAQGVTAADQEVISQVASQRPDLLLDHMVIAGTRGYLLMEPVPVAGPHVRSGVWSPDGRYALLEREPARTTPAALGAALQGASAALSVRRSLVLWDRQKGDARPVWTAPLAGGDVDHVEWLPGTRVALAVVTATLPGQPEGDTPRSSRALLRVDAVSGTARTLAEVPPEATTDGWLSIDVSPLKPVAVLWVRRMTGDPSQADVLNLVVPAGLGPALKGERIWLRGIVWSDDGKPVLRFSETAPEAGKTRPVSFAAVDVTTGALTRLSAAPAPYQPTTAEPPLKLTIRAASLGQGTPAHRVRQTWIEGDSASDAPRALVTPDADWAILSPSGDAVLFGSQGTAFVSAVVSVPAQVVADARKAALRAQVLSRGKQAALGLLMWSQDNDERFPDASEFSPALLAPYLKDSSAADGFVYTLAGGKLSDISAPAQTELGYVPGPGGRAVVYVDGHVKWRGD